MKVIINILISLAGRSAGYTLIKVN